MWTRAENLVPTGIRSPDRPDRRDQLYRIRYPGPHDVGITQWKRFLTGKSLKAARTSSTLTFMTNKKSKVCYLETHADINTKKSKTRWRQKTKLQKKKRNLKPALNSESREARKQILVICHRHTVLCTEIITALVCHQLPCQSSTWNEHMDTHSHYSQTLHSSVCHDMLSRPFRHTRFLAMSITSYQIGTANISIYSSIKQLWSLSLTVCCQSKVTNLGPRLSTHDLTFRQSKLMQFQKN